MIYMPLLKRGAKKMGGARNPEREAKIVALAHCGTSYREIGRKFKISVSRVFQIVKAYERRNQTASFNSTATCKP